MKKRSTPTPEFPEHTRLAGSNMCVNVRPAGRRRQLDDVLVYSFGCSLVRASAEKMLRLLLGEGTCWSYFHNFQLLFSKKQSIEKKIQSLSSSEGFLLFSHWQKKTQNFPTFLAEKNKQVLSK